MVHPGAFRGSRKDFLVGEKTDYAAAVAGGYKKDAIANIQRRYLKRYPIELDHDKEPAPNDLAKVDDDAPEVEPEEPDREKMTPEEYDKAVERAEERSKLLNFRKGQIARWLSYQYMKDSDADFFNTGSTSPNRLFIQKLLGSSAARPRFQPAANIWRKANRDDIEAETIRRAAEKGVDKKKLAPVREKVVKDLYNALDDEAKEDWTSLAKQDHIDALSKWEAVFTNPAPDTPLHRQRAIQGVESFMQQVLDMIADHTGWKASFICGGPEPADEGRLNIISAHAGHLPGDIKMTFGSAEQARYRNTFVPIFGDFLRKCYTPEECRRRALPKEYAAQRLHDLDLGNADLHTIELEKPEAILRNDSDSSNLPATSSDRPTSATDKPTHSKNIIPPANVPVVTVAPPSDSLVVLVASTANVAENADVVAQTNASTDLHTADMEMQAPQSQDVIQSHQPSSPCVSSPPSPPASVVQSPAQTPTITMSVALPQIQQVEPIEPTRSSPRKRKLTSADSNESNPNHKGKRQRNKAGAVDDGPQDMSDSIDDLAPDLATAPDWFSSSFKSFAAAPLGESWRALLRDWMVFEADSHYEEKVRLTSTHRPEVVKMWISRARSTSWRPAITNVKEFKEKFTKWWKAIQPEWRKSDGLIETSKVDGDWELLRLPGLNGLHSVIAALFYWGLALKANAVKDKDWLAAVDDCHLVINHLLSK